MTTPARSRPLRCAALVAAMLACAPLVHAQAPTAERPQEAWWMRGPDEDPVRIHRDAKVTPSQRVRLQRHADLGLDALRRYVWITRGIWNWQLKELLDPAGDA
jgi:hypothetical protein